MEKQFDVNTYDYELPEELIAQQPAGRRDESRLLVLNRQSGRMSHGAFRDIAGHLGPGDCLVLNNTKVIPARISGTTATGASIEVLLVENVSGRRWDVMMKNSRRVKEGSEIGFKEGLRARVAEKRGKMAVVDFSASGKELSGLLDKIGETPLPPYITAGPAERKNRERYQTVYARHEGSSAAPTAGLHFTRELLSRLKASGVEAAEVTLHVGPGTFEPVSERDIRKHVMHTELFSVGPGAAEKINAAKRVIAVGTTSLRVMEASADMNGKVIPGKGRTNIFIFPGYRFRAADALITNFHLPKSTLLMLVCALAGTENTLAAYKEAIKERYRFFSYGDAMLII